MTSPGVDLAGEVDALRAEVRDLRTSFCDRPRDVESLLSLRVPQRSCTHSHTHSCPQVKELKAALNMARAKDVELASYMEVRGGTRRRVRRARRKKRPADQPAHSTPITHPTPNKHRVAHRN